MKLTKNLAENKQKNKFKKKVLAELYFARVFLYLVFISAQIVIAYFLDRLLELAIILISYTLLRWCYPKTWHHKQVLYCLLYSVAFFMILQRLSLPLSVSLFSGIVISILFTYYLYKFQCVLDAKIEKTKSTRTVLDLTKTEFYELLNESTISQEEKDAVEYRVIYHYKGQQWYQACGFCKRNCQYLYNSGIRKLNNQLQVKLNNH